MLPCLVLIAVLMSYAITRWMIRYAHARDLIDRKNERSSHTVPTPRGGGLGIVVTYVFIVLALVFFESLNWVVASILLVGSVPVALVGFLDDHGDVKPIWRLVIQFLAAAAVILLLGGFSALDILGITIPGFLINSIVLIGMVWITNLYNFMDGIDGIAASEAIFVFIAIAFIFFLHSQFLAMIDLCVALAAACGGFLLLNWSPAKIFMGDVGSGALGMILASLLALILKTEPLLSVSCLFLLACFIVDATLTLFKRILRGEKIYHPHRQHAYQHLAKKLGSHQQVTLGITGLNCLWVAPLAILASFYPKYVIFTGFVLFMPLIYFAHLAVKK